MHRFDLLNLNRHLPSATFVLIVMLVFAGFAGVFIYTGAYNIGADAPHSRFVYNTLDALRERAIAARSRDIRAPANFNDPKRIAAGAELYGEMCTGCHLGPGLEKSELSQGLYPQAPELALGNKHTPEQQFWIIKHGVKLTAMPAWGKTHDDQLIWDMVAFIRQLPKMSPQQYKTAVASTPESHEEMMKGMAGTAEEHGTASKRHMHSHGR
jgi:mono/diheme cytochrome c family protein